MNNSEEILKRIILNMKYDSKKTLSENRNLLREECIPKDTKLTDIVSGKPRSEKYPELGNWDDGNCKCSEEECLRYDKSCCKNVITVGPLEKGGIVEPPPEGSVEINGIDYKGDAMTLPEGVTKVKYFDTWDKKYIPLRNDYNLVAKTYPRLAEKCLEYQPQSYNKCLTDSSSKLFDMLPQNSIIGFTYDGIKYGWCFSLNEDLSIGFSDGYFGLSGLEEPNDCGTIPWAQKSKEIKNLKTTSQVEVDKTVDSSMVGSVQTDKRKDTMSDNPIVGSEDSKNAKTDDETIRLVMQGDGGN